MAGRSLNLALLRPTKQIVTVLRLHGRLNRKQLWEALVAEGTTIESKAKAKSLLRWLWERNRVQLHGTHKEKGRVRWEYSVHEGNEQKADRRMKDKYRYPKPKEKSSATEQKETEVS